MVLVGLHGLIRCWHPTDISIESVNSDPTNSPLKHSRTNSKDKINVAKDDAVKVIRERNRAKDRAQAQVISQLDEKEAAPLVTAPPKPLEPPPETPVPLSNDLFSPNPSEPSAPRADLRDTPPPPDLGPDTNTGSFGRASRRPKGSVNYAQPNLRDKMRRPTAELVDAVAAEERARKASIALEASKAVVIKQEDVTDGLPPWKTNEPRESHRKHEEPTSPLSTKTGETSKDLPPNIITERRRRTIAPTNRGEDTNSGKGIPGASTTIAALTANNHRSQQNDVRTLETSERRDSETYGPEERPSIYDFAGSSPSNGINDEVFKHDEEVAKPSRSSRRHSTVPATSEQSKGTLSISRERRGERRKESIVGGIREENASSGTMPAAARTKSVLELRDGGEGSTMSRGERAASRRRSMML